MIAAVVAAAAFAFTPGAAESFESMTSLPADWKLVEFATDQSKASLKRGKAPDGKVYVRVSAKTPNHSRLFIPTTVEPQSTYRFSAKLRGEGRPDFPASLGVDGSLDTTGSVPGDGKWHERDFYIRTGSAGQVSLVLSLGGFGDTVVGTADFDVLQFEKVTEEPPQGARVATIQGASPQDLEQAADIPGPNGLTIPLVVLAGLLAVGCAVVLKRGDRAR
ncbi:MAG: hypothetical protein Q7T55_00270 [Solirubrobacteraceae bacterium]|nr:hypothetical protein [Solirubrobacteraceae bacterium]